LIFSLVKRMIISLVIRMIDNFTGDRNGWQSHWWYEWLIFISLLRMSTIHITTENINHFYHQWNCQSFLSPVRLSTIHITTENINHFITRSLWSVEWGNRSISSESKLCTFHKSLTYVITWRFIEYTSAENTSPRKLC
jgi:hypothetical protein